MNSLPEIVKDNIFSFFDPYKIMYQKNVVEVVNKFPKFCVWSWNSYQNSVHLCYCFPKDKEVFCVGEMKGEYQTQDGDIFNRTLSEVFGFCIKSAIVRSTDIKLKHMKKIYGMSSKVQKRKSVYAWGYF